MGKIHAELQKTVVLTMTEEHFNIIHNVFGVLERAAKIKERGIKDKDKYKDGDIDIENALNIRFDVVCPVSRALDTAKSEMYDQGNEDY